MFELLRGRDIVADITYYSKSNAYKHIRESRDYFYKLAWFCHFRRVLPGAVRGEREVFVGIASLGERRKRNLNAEAVATVVQQCMDRRVRRHCVYWSAASHPCLQAADYYCWAVQRWIEGGDSRSYDLVKNQIQTLIKIF